MNSLPSACSKEKAMSPLTQVTFPRMLELYQGKVKPVTKINEKLLELCLCEHKNGNYHVILIPHIALLIFLMNKHGANSH